MIPLEKEPDWLAYALGPVPLYEACHFCKRKTDTWHKRTNNPVCRRCAKDHSVSELPNHGRVGGGQS